MPHSGAHPGFIRASPSLVNPVDTCELQEGIHDVRLMVEDLLAEGDKVWRRFTGRGTHNGSFVGLPATSRPIEIDVIDTCCFQDGRMVEHRGIPDQFTLLQQVRALPTPRPHRDGPRTRTVGRPGPTSCATELDRSRLVRLRGRQRKYG